MIPPSFSHLLSGEALQFLQTFHSPTVSNHQVSSSSSTSHHNPSQTSNKIEQMLFDQDFKSLLLKFNRHPENNGSQSLYPQTYPNPFPPSYYHPNHQVESSGSHSRMYLPQQAIYRIPSINPQPRPLLSNNTNPPHLSHINGLGTPFNYSLGGTSPSPTIQALPLNQPLPITTELQSTSSQSSFHKPNPVQNNHTIDLSDTEQPKRQKRKTSPPSSSIDAPNHSIQPDPLSMQIKELQSELSSLKSTFELYKVDTDEKMRKQDNINLLLNKTFEFLTLHSCELTNAILQLKDANQLLVQSVETSALKQSELLKWQITMIQFKKNVDGLIRGSSSLNLLKDKPK